MKKIITLVLAIALLMTSVVAIAETKGTPNINTFAKMTTKTDEANGIITITMSKPVDRLLVNWVNKGAEPEELALDENLQATAITWGHEKAMPGVTLKKTNYTWKVSDVELVNPEGAAELAELAAYADAYDKAYYGTDANGDVNTERNAATGTVKKTINRNTSEYQKAYDKQYDKVQKAMIKQNADTMAAYLKERKVTAYEQLTAAEKAKVDTMLYTAAEIIDAAEKSAKAAGEKKCDEIATKKGDEAYDAAKLLTQTANAQAVADKAAKAWVVAPSVTYLTDVGTGSYILDEDGEKIVLDYKSGHIYTVTDRISKAQTTKAYPSDHAYLTVQGDWAVYYNRAGKIVGVELYEGQF